MTIPRAIFPILAGVGITGGLSAQTSSAPNVIYIFPDQFRNSAMNFWGDKGFTEHVNFTADPVHTPNIDRFALESVVLSSAQSNCPLSSPHRGMLLSGMYPQRNGVTLNCNSNRPLSGLRSDITTISDVYSRNGYQCAYIGKYHADYPTANDPQRSGYYVEDKMPAWDAYTPVERRHGFDYWYSYGTFDVHKSPHYWDTDGNRHEVRQWSPQHEADKLIEYLHENRDDEKPFIIMWSINPPHSPYNSLEDCMEQDFDLYKDRPLDSLLIRPNVNPALIEKRKCAPYYFASVTGVDREFGRVLDALRQLGLDKNTIVVFTSDHGETMASHVLDPKNSPYSESMNVPFIIRYPQALTPHVNPLLLSSIDIMPTLLSLSGLQGDIPQQVQGRDLSAYMKNGNDKTAPQGVLYIRNSDGEKDADGKVVSYFPAARGVKTARHTMAITINRRSQMNDVLLFDDLNDPYQMNNLSITEHKEVFAELCSLMGKLLKDGEDPWYTDRILPDMIPY